jgi:hypothetical protein
MDLLLALILITLTSFWAMIVGIRLGQTASTRLQLIIQLLVVVACSCYFFFVWDRPFLSQYLPHTALIVLANWHPMMGSFFAGMYLASGRIKLRRRLILGPMTLALAGYSIVAPVLGHAPICATATSASPLIAQTTPYTCSPAAAASLLRLYGIAATESEMAKLCLTRHGTHWMGVYRGLKLMTEGTPWEVVAQPFSRKAVMSLGDSPALLSINIDTDRIRTCEDHGFRGSSGHSVLALGSRDHREVMVFDPAPSYGIERWDRKLLSWVSHGVILRLRPRNGTEDEEPVRNRITEATRQYDQFACIGWNSRI